MQNVHVRRVAAPIERVRPWIEACWSGGVRDCFPRDVIPTWRRNPPHADPSALIPGETMLGHGPFRFRLRAWDGHIWRVDAVSRVGGWHGFDLEPDGEGCRVTHTLELDGSLSTRLAWMAIAPAHDWAVEALFDRLEYALATGAAPARTERPMSRAATLALAFARRRHRVHAASSRSKRTTHLRVAPAELERLELIAGNVLGDVPLHDVSAVDLTGGGPGRTLADVRARLDAGAKGATTPLVRALFALRWALGRLFGWDRERAEHAASSYVHRVSPELRHRSLVTPGTPDGPFRLLYMLPHESLAEIQNATVHAFLATRLVENDAGYRLYWAVYVKPVSWLTPLYMALIEPFRRFVVYPSILRRLQRTWAT